MITRTRTVATAALMTIVLSVLTSASASAVTGSWTMFHHDPTHTGVAEDNAIGVGNAGGLGLDWAVNTGAASYTSPVVAHSASLGKTLVYAANQMGAISAYDAGTGDRQWVLQLAASIQSSPAVVNNVIYFGANDHRLYAVNASTGATICSYETPGNISSSPTIVNPGSGLVVYFGENGITGADDGGHEFAINGVDPNAATDCSLKWSFSGFGNPPGSAKLAGSWSPPAYGVDKNGRKLVVFGGSSPDCAVYAVDALTGQLVWRFQSQIFAQDNDVGAGPTITPPGVNGFVDGRVYVGGKDRIFYSLNLRTGSKDWQFSIRDDSPNVGGATRSTAAVLNDKLYVGYGAGVYALNAKTGAKVWKTQQFGVTTQEVISSPAITGANGPGSGRVLFVGDMAGKFRAFSMGGALKWTYTTGGFIYGSPAIADGHVFTTSSDGFLYAFAPGGAIGPKPTTSITSPAAGATVDNTGSVTVTGSAGDNTKVSKVLVAVKNKNSGQWWNAGTNSWGKTYQETQAALSNPGGASTNWDMSFDVPFNGGPFQIEASAVDGGGQHDPDAGLGVDPGQEPWPSAGYDHHQPGVPAGVPPGRQLLDRAVRGALLHQRERHRHRFRRRKPGHRAGAGDGAKHRACRVQLRARHRRVTRGLLAADAGSRSRRRWPTPAPTRPTGRSSSRSTTTTTSTGSWPGRWTRTARPIPPGRPSTASACATPATTPARRPLRY